MLKTLLPLAFAVTTGVAVAADAPKKPQGAKPASTQPAEVGRDWSKIDTNKDGLISPEEMEKYLAENPGPQKK
jgi:hypothetical protein